MEFLSNFEDFEGFLSSVSFAYMFVDTWTGEFLKSKFVGYNLGCHWVRSKASKRSLDPPAKYVVGIPVRPFKMEFLSNFKDFEGFLSSVSFAYMFADTWPGGFLESKSIGV